MEQKQEHQLPRGSNCKLGREWETECSGRGQIQDPLGGKHKD